MLPAGKELDFSLGVMGGWATWQRLQGRVGEGALLGEGGAQGSTLERLGRTEVVLHGGVFLILTLAAELQAAEFGHL